MKPKPRRAAKTTKLPIVLNANISLWIPKRAWARLFSQRNHTKQELRDFVTGCIPELADQLRARNVMLAGSANPEGWRTEHPVVIGLLSEWVVGDGWRVEA